MFESSTDEYVYKYQDKTSESVEYISVEELLTAEWKDVVSPTIIVIQNNDMNLPLPKVPVHNSNNETKKKFIGMSLIIWLNENLHIQLKLVLLNLFLM